MVKRWLYRVRQFHNTLTSRPSPNDLALVRTTLTSGQFELFTKLQPSEQAHAIRVLERVLEKCQAKEIAPPDDLLVAALLHDVGKIRYPMRTWERVLIVLGKAMLPEYTKHWTNHSPRGWARPFVVAAYHPDWGADLAAEQGTSPRAVALILRHQDKISEQGLSQEKTHEDQLLAILQAADDEN
jgi:hypothetical protein